MLETFSEGVADVQYATQHSTDLLIRRRTVSLQHSADGAFREGLAPAADKNDLWGFIDHTGKWVIQPQYVLLYIHLMVCTGSFENTRSEEPHVFVMNDKS